MTAPLPPNETERLRALRRYAILDTPPEAAFDRITRLAARLLKVPITLVSLVDGERQWFKSCFGVEVQQSDRENSFCAHAILENEVMVVPDLAKDHRFAGNAFVTGDPHIRFYAGAPLTTRDGFNLGTVCALDTVPREFTAEEREILRDLAAMVRDELELRLALRETSQQATAIFQLKSGVTLTDPNLPDNPIVFGNPGFWETTGFKPEDVTGRNCRFLQGPETSPETLKEIRKVLKEQTTFRGEILNYRADGSSFWNELTISPVFDDAGKLINFVGLQNDITERKRLSDQLKQSYEKLKELEMLRDNLTHMIIHDLRSPLTTVIGFLDLLQSGAANKLSKSEAEFVDFASSGAATLQEMITSLLDVDRMEAGGMPLSLQDADIREIIKTATDPLMPIVGTRSLFCEFPDFPLTARCDAEVIRRVVANLVSNAVKFTRANGEIRVSVESEGNQVKVSVSDTGEGIPAEFLGKIFEKGSRPEDRKDCG